MDDGPGMVETFITFGVQYGGLDPRRVHHPRDSRLDADGWVVIEARNHMAAREIAHNVFGGVWAFDYSAESFEPKYHPLGEIGRVKNGALHMIEWDELEARKRRLA